MKIIPAAIVLLVLMMSLFGSMAVPFAAAANANLFVSAENSQFQNHFAGPMVIEVAVIDGAISDTGTPQPEPDVTVNGNKLRMVQATDGNWYAYFADKTMAQRADQTVGLEGKGLDFGKFCNKASGGLGTSFSQTVGVAVPRSLLLGTDGMNAFQSCNGGPSNTTPLNHVVREPRTINTNVNSTGQIGLNQFAWPIIQLYDFNIFGNVVVQYNKGGGVQSTTLTFDTVGQFVSMGINSNEYPKGSKVSVGITDPQLNIDPTDEDSWTWATTIGSSGSFYQLFDEDGNADADGTGGAINLIGVQNNMMFEDNGVLGLVPKQPADATFAVNLVDNNDQRLFQGSDITQARTEGNSLMPGTQPMTFTESGKNTGNFANFDEINNANLIVTTDAQDGSFATLHYNALTLNIQVEMPQVAPNPPSVSAFSISSSQIDLSWNVSTGATSYVVERSSMSSVSGFATIATTPNTSYSDNGLQPNTTYYYRIYASNANGPSVASSPVSAATLNLPPPTQSLTVNIGKTSYFSGQLITVFGLADPSSNFQKKLDWTTTARLVDGFGNNVGNLEVNEQAQITAGLTNNQNNAQNFVFLVKIDAENSDAVSLAWITGSLSMGQSFNPALSWIPQKSGTYLATIYLIENIDQMRLLAPPLTLKINVGSQPAFEPKPTPSFTVIPVVIKITCDSYVTSVVHAIPNAGGAYSVNVKGGGILWNKYGNCLVYSSQGSQTAETDFAFSAAPEDTPQDTPEDALIEETPTEEPRIQCAPGTVLQNGVCVTEDIDEPQEEILTETPKEPPAGEPSNNTWIYVLGGTGAAAIIGTVAYFAKTHFGTKPDVNPNPPVNCWIEIHGGLDNE